MKNLRKGFTLIELLIVIALLGALAVGLLAALDPFEQLKKGTDTGTRNTVSELHGAIVRYYSVKNEMPWVVGAVTSIDTPTDANSGYTTIGIDKVINNGELKGDFQTLAGTARLGKISVLGTPESVTVCFRPESKSFRADVNTKYLLGVDTGANTPANCGNPNDTNFSCSWCIR